MRRPKLWIALAFGAGIIVGAALMYPINVKATLALPPARGASEAHP